MEILVVLVILGFIFFGPMTIALIAMSQVRGLRRRVEDAERSFEVRSRRLADRFEALGVYPVPAAPPPAPPPPPMPAIPKPEPAPVRPALLPVRTAPVPVPPVRPAPVMSRPAVVAPVPAMAVAPASPKEEVPLENMIGERVLPRIGVIAIVFGLALLVWYAWGQFGKEGKIALTASTGAAMVVGGVLLRRNAYTQLLGSCLIGGGWAVLYITAYASHSIQASRIIASPVLGFVLLMAVAEAALIHALRYRSETIAGIAYLLTIATLLISPAPLGAAAAWCAIGLSGAVVLALALKEKWIRLCVVGAKLLYIAEAVWLSRTPPENILVALGVLVLLWLMWTLPSYFLKPKTDWDKRFHALLVGINSVGLLVSGFLIQRWFNLEDMGWVWITLGALNALMAFIGRNAAWRPAYLANLVTAALFIAVGTREQFAPLGSDFAWMAIAASLFAWGIWRRDAFPRFMGLAGIAITFATFWTFDRGVGHAAAAALVLPALLYVAAATVVRLKSFSSVEKTLAEPLAHVGALALGLAISRYAPELTAGIYFALGGLILLLTGIRAKARGLVAEGVVFLTIPIFYLTSETLMATGDVAGVSRRLASTVPILLAWLLAGRFISTTAPHGKDARGYFSAILFGGVLALSATELQAPQAPVAWALASAVWYVWSRLAKRPLEFILATLGAVGAVVIYATEPALLVPAVGWTGPVASGAILLAIYVAIHLASRRGASDEIVALTRDLLAAVIAVTAFTLLARELTGMWRTGSWTILAFALGAYGLFMRDRVSRWTGLLVLGAALGDVALVNTPQAPVTWALVMGALVIWSRVTRRDLELKFAASVVAVLAVVMYAAVRELQVPVAGWTGPVASGAFLSAILLAIHLASRREASEGVHSHTRDVFAAAMAVTLFTLLAREMTGTWLTGSWAVLGFALAAYGFLVRDRVSRWSSLLVLGICIGKVAIFDLATFDMPVKIATLLTLGAVMVTLSFVYARHHRRIVVYLAGKDA